MFPIKIIKNEHFRISSNENYEYNCKNSSPVVTKMFVSHYINDYELLNRYMLIEIGFINKHFKCVDLKKNFHYITLSVISQKWSVPCVWYNGESTVIESVFQWN
jgi:uncharacterized protein YodC (DUF2158 family)